MYGGTASAYRRDPIFSAILAAHYGTTASPNSLLAKPVRGFAQVGHNECFDRLGGVSNIGAIQMSLGIHIDISAWDLVRRLNASELALYSSMEKLSSGLAIKGASAGPAVLILSERLRAQVSSLGQEIENLSAQQHKYEFASATVLRLRADLSELRSLAIGAAHEGVNDPAMQTAYDTAARHAAEAYNQTIETAAYNGRALFDGSDESLALIHPIGEVDLSTAEAAESSLVLIDRAAKELDNVQIDLGATQKNDLDSEQRSLMITQQNLLAAESELRDTDYVREYTNFLAEAMRLRAGVALLAHSRVTAAAVLALLGTQAPSPPVWQ